MFRYYLLKHLIKSNIILYKKNMFKMINIVKERVANYFNNYSIKINENIVNS